MQTSLHPSFQIVNIMIYLMMLKIGQMLVLSDMLLLKIITQIISSIFLLEIMLLNQLVKLVKCMNTIPYCSR